jgi:3-hydroxyacyl-[acyl-carrier-protein] dehydratase
MNLQNDSKKLKKEDLMKILPHRDPMLLLDGGYITENGGAVAEYTVKGDEFFLQGHFPDSPVVPGVILCEIMAQACAVMFGDKSGTPLYTGLNNVRFKKPVRPGDTVRAECEILRGKGIFYFAAGKLTVGGELCASGEFSFAVIEDKSEKHG